MSEDPATYNVALRPDASHHPHGPSAIGNPCTGSYRMSLGLPRVDGGLADAGRRIHEAVAALVTGYALPEGLEPDEAEAAEACFAAARKLHHHLPPFNSVTCYAELAGTLTDPATGEVIATGTMDYLAIAGDTAVLTDWKTGYRVSGMTADQLAAYAGMALCRFPQLERVHVVAFYPRLGIFAPTLTTYERADLPDIVENYRGIIAMREDTTRLDLVPGDHCEYCPAATICPARRMELARVEAAFTTLDALTPRQIAELVPVARRVSKLADAILDRAKALAADGCLPGYRLQAVQGRETVAVDAAALYQVIKAELGPLSAARCVQPATPATIKAVIKDHPDWEAAKRATAVLSGLLARGPGHGRLVEDAQ